MKGKFIVFEGGEGAGKTTQMQRLIHWLQSSCYLKVGLVATREPGGTELGKQLRHLLLKQDSGELVSEMAELLMYAADRAQHVETFLKPELSKGTIVLCDRFTDSTIAYQGYGRGLKLNLIKQLNEIATGGLQSDLTLWLDIDVEAGLARVRARGERDRMEQADFNFHRLVQQGFGELAEEHKSRIVRINGDRSEDEVAQEIQTIVTRKLEAWGYLNNPNSEK
ncbi:dTMP kinase [Tychonema sp. LEGE 07199]|uniref:dTMP kinase n=1 Tax=unclassified Tychonema TaxID=2642144 RepID=UPI001880AC51|nr:MULTISPECIES: dTMP kinase [unclassified Tychonema]MBE9124000.1 dTMP kinase [Tychonema sp. LEGE 07199]MBE9135295.1 dTMP kinase [Tychonema sp. LEGE 07196]